jgi:hypothetical protein
MSNECPVCFAVCKEDIAQVDYTGPICEHFVVCPNNCYDYAYAYGTSVVAVVIRGHQIVFGWNYDAEDYKSEMDACQIVVQAAQKAQLEDYWVLVNDGKDKADRSEEPRQPDLDNGLAFQ